MKTFHQAPLPFQGQKRKFLKEFKTALNEFSPTATYVDLFGGSGFLSHSIKQHYPNAKVVYNDFDGYSHRLENVDTTNGIIADIREIVKDLPDNSRITGEYKDQIIHRIKQEKGFVDCITISSSLLFSMNYVTEKEAFAKQTFYNNVKQTNYFVDGYLDGVDRVKMDYRDLFAEFRDQKDVVFLLDPPYLSTDVSSYNKKDYWKLADYLNVLKCIEDSAYFYFTSNKSQIIELCDWMEINGYCKNPFDGSVAVTKGTQMNKNSRYTDIMIYKTNE
jgi:16S rRNA G966 N2-methylase RsmD